MTFAASPSGAQRLSAAEKAVLSMEILVAYARARWLLSRSDLGSALESLRARRASGDLSLDGDAHTASLRLARAVSRTLAVLPTDSPCLIRSLVLTALLTRRAIDSSLVIGVRTEPDFAAHAWVERAGRPVSSSHGYSRLLAM